MSSKRRLSQTTPASVNKLSLDSLNKILKIGNISKSKKQREAKIVKQVSRAALAELVKNTPSVGAQGIPDFKTFLSNKDNIDIFREFLKTQYCQENIDFYLACEKFRQLDPDRVGKDLIKFMATQIYNDHLAESAKQPVNLEHNCLQNIIKQMKEPHPNMLCDAQAAIFDLMKNDCYPRFCKNYRLDKDLARKILLESSTINSTPQSRKDYNITLDSMTNPSSSYCMSCNSSQSKGIKRKSPSQTSSSYLSTRAYNRVNGARSRQNTLDSCIKKEFSCNSSQFEDIERVDNSATGCPLDCPYFRVGLPCLIPRHNNDKQHSQVEQVGSSDLIDKIDLSRIHHVPNICKRRTPPPPPPPPLPPKPDELELYPVENKKYCPYVGKVFDV